MGYTPPTVTITSPQNNETVLGIVTITCMATDNEGIAKVELWVDGDTTGIVDHTEPYSLDWNAETYEDGAHCTSLEHMGQKELLY